MSKIEISPKTDFYFQFRKSFNKASHILSFVKFLSFFWQIGLDRKYSICPVQGHARIRTSNLFIFWIFFFKNQNFGQKEKNCSVKIWPEIIFSNDELDIILKRCNWEICKHSSFFNYWRNCFLIQTWSSEICKILNYHY